MARLKLMETDDGLSAWLSDELGDGLWWLTLQDDLLETADWYAPGDRIGKTGKTGADMVKEYLRAPGWVSAKVLKAARSYLTVPRLKAS